MMMVKKILLPLCLLNQHLQAALSFVSAATSCRTQRPFFVGLYMSKQQQDSNISGEKGNIPSDLSWLKEAMDSSYIPEPDGVLFLENKQGISGFAVDPKLGFVVVVVGGDRATYAVVSPKDKKQVRSSEALCLVQLAGGLDLGTPVLPPDILARLVAEETGQSARELRQQIKLCRVDVVANKDNRTNSVREEPPVAPKSTPERDSHIETQAPKVAQAVNKLPGLVGECTLEQVTEALRIYADENGMLDRTGFTALLDYLRRSINWIEPSKIDFVLVVALQDIEFRIPAPSAMIGVGLALRYKVDVVLSKECQREGFDAIEIPGRFPAFRPIKELKEDARIIDKFIPALFNQATAPKNEDKM